MRSALLHCYLSLSHTGRALSCVSDFGRSESPPCAAIWAVLMRLCSRGGRYGPPVLRTAVCGARLKLARRAYISYGVVTRSQERCGSSLLSVRFRIAAAASGLVARAWAWPRSHSSHDGSHLYGQALVRGVGGTELSTRRCRSAAPAGFPGRGWEHRPSRPRCRPPCKL